MLIFDSIHTAAEEERQRRSAEHSPQPSAPAVRVVDFTMPFWSLVGFMIKVSLASIPAVIILAVVYLFAVAIFGGVLAGIRGY